jgi:hypothetical protein
VKSAVAPTATTFDITTSWYASPEPDIFEVCAEDDRLAIGLWGNNFIPESGHQTPEDNRRPKLDIAQPLADSISRFNRSPRLLHIRFGSYRFVGTQLASLPKAEVLDRGRQRF